jgi:hypothetical protein
LSWVSCQRPGDSEEPCAVSSVLCPPGRSQGREQKPRCTGRLPMGDKRPAGPGPGSSSGRVGTAVPTQTGVGLSSWQPGFPGQGTSHVSIWPNLKFSGSTSHLPWNCEKHSVTFLICTVHPLSLQFLRPEESSRASLLWLHTHARHTHARGSQTHGTHTGPTCTS